MEPKIVEMDALTLVGMSCFGNNANREFSKIWELFLPRMETIPKALATGRSFGVELYPAEYSSTGMWFYMAAREVSDLSEMPLDMVAKIIPPATYAVFTHTGPIERLPETYRHGYRTWLPASPYESAAWFDLELYGDRFKGDAPDSEIDVCIPVKRR